MAMGIVSEKDFIKEKSQLENPKPESKPIVGTVEIIDKGRGLGNVEVPDSLRQLIGCTANESGRAGALDLAKRFGISASSVSAYSEGATSTASYDDKPNKPVIDASRLRVVNRARGKMMRAIHHITEDKLVGAKARDLAGIAKDMSAVIKTMEPPPETGPGGGINTNGPAFIFYAPQVKKEESYDVIYSKD